MQNHEDLVSLECNILVSTTDTKDVKHGESSTDPEKQTSECISLFYL